MLLPRITLFSNLLPIPHLVIFVRAQTERDIARFDCMSAKRFSIKLISNWQKCFNLSIEWLRLCFDSYNNKTASYAFYRLLIWGSGFWGDIFVRSMWLFWIGIRLGKKYAKEFRRRISVVSVEYLKEIPQIGLSSGKISLSSIFLYFWLENVSLSSIWRKIIYFIIKINLVFAVQSKNFECTQLAM